MRQSSDRNGAQSPEPRTQNPCALEQGNCPRSGDFGRILCCVPGDNQEHGRLEGDTGAGSSSWGWCFFVVLCYVLPALVVSAGLDFEGRDLLLLVPRVVGSGVAAALTVWYLGR